MGNPRSVSQLERLVRELEEWKERAQVAEARVVKLERKIAGHIKRNDPREKFRKRHSRERFTSKTPGIDPERRDRDVQPNWRH